MAQVNTSEKKKSTSKIKMTKDQIKRIINQIYEPIMYDLGNGRSACIYADKNLLSEDFFVGLSSFAENISSKINKPNKNIYVFDWDNKGVYTYIRNIGYDRNALFLLLPNPLVHYERGTEAVETLVTFNEDELEVNCFERKMLNLGDEASICSVSADTIEIMKDDSGINLGSYCSKFFKFYHDGFFANHDKETSKKYSENIFKLMTELYKNLPSEEEKRAIKMAKEYSEYVIRKQEVQKEEAKRKVSDLASRLADQYVAIQRLEKESLEANSIYRSLSTRISSFNKNSLEEGKLSSIFKTMLSVRFHDVKFLSNGIEAYTKTIYAKDTKVNSDGQATNKWYKIGDFKVTIGFNGVVQFQNLTYRPDNYYDHPHVSNKMPCLGNYKNILPKMIMTGDYLGVLMIAYEFLLSYTWEEGFRPYTEITRWPEATEDEALIALGKKENPNQTEPTQSETNTEVVEQGPPTEDEEFLDDEEFDEDGE